MLHFNVHTKCVYTHLYAYMYIRTFHKLYLHIYAYMPFIYINSERRYYTLFLFLPFEKRRWNFFNSIIHVSRVILYKSMPYLHEKIQFLFLSFFFLLDLVRYSAIVLTTQNSSILILFLLLFVLCVVYPHFVYIYTKRCHIISDKSMINFLLIQYLFYCARYVPLNKTVEREIMLIYKLFKMSRNQQEAITRCYFFLYRILTS